MIKRLFSIGLLVVSFSICFAEEPPASFLDPSGLPTEIFWKAALEKRLNIVGTEMTSTDALTFILHKAHVAYNIHGASKKRVTISVKEMKLRDILWAVHQQTGLKIEVTGKEILVTNAGK